MDRWLRRIHLLVGDQARVLLVATHADRHRADLDLAALQHAYPTVLAGLIEVDNGHFGTLLGHAREAWMKAEKVAVDLEQLPVRSPGDRHDQGRRRQDASAQAQSSALLVLEDPPNGS